MARDGRQACSGEAVMNTEAAAPWKQHSLASEDFAAAMWTGSRGGQRPVYQKGPGSSRLGLHQMQALPPALSLTLWSSQREHEEPRNAHRIHTDGLRTE